MKSSCCSKIFSHWILYFMGGLLVVASLWAGTTDKTPVENEVVEDIPLTKTEVSEISSVSPGGVEKEDKVLATVNGVPIYESQLMEGMPSNSFQFRAQQVMRTKLNHKINMLVFLQFFDRENIQTTEEDIDKQVAYLKQNPPPLGCICCSYNTLEQFMQAYNLTMKELRENIRVEQESDIYMEHLWDQMRKNETESKELAQKEREGLENSYRKVYHIFFNTFQQTNYKTNPDAIRNEAKTKAEAAWNRLNKGESFEDLASEVSEDKNSKEHGGYLGCIPKNTFGNTLEKIEVNMKPDEYTNPVESFYGFHIFRIEPMEDADILDLVKRKYLTQKAKELYEKIMKDAKIVRFE